MDKVKQSIAWGLMIVGFLILLLLAATGRLGIVFAIALVPDSVTVK